MSEHVCAYKIQKAFFDLYANGKVLLGRLVEFIREQTPGTAVIIDCKIGDINNTMRAYLQSILTDLGADGVVINPYMGTDVLSSFSAHPDKLGVVLVQTSNPGGAVIQEVELEDGRQLWRYILEIVIREWKKGNALIPCLSNNAAYNLKGLRSYIPNEMPVFLAGIGAQGGQIACIPSILNVEKKGVLVNSSRAILYPFKPSEPNWQGAIVNAVVTLKNAINDLRK